MYSDEANTEEDTILELEEKINDPRTSDFWRKLYEEKLNDMLYRQSYINHNKGRYNDE